jgi:hypothetical protein
MTETGTVDVEIVCAWDSGETRPEGFASEFCREFDIPVTVEKLEDMVDKVDGVIVHTANWDRHLEQARLFVEANKAVLIDKPIVGNMRDANILLDWMKQGRRITGGSSLRFAKEVCDYLAQPVKERGEVHTAYSAIGVDDFNYGIHAYAILSCLMGPGIQSVQFICESRQKNILLRWENGRIAFLTIGKAAWLPFNVSAVTDKNVFMLSIDNSRIYKSLLEAQLPYLTGKTEERPLSSNEILEPEFTAMAARQSWMNNGQKVFLTDLHQDMKGYDGSQFAREYRRSRISKA